MDNTCTESGCNNVEFSKGKCIGHSMITDGEGLKTRPRPIERATTPWHYTKIYLDHKR